MDESVLYLFKGVVINFYTLFGVEEGDTKGDRGIQREIVECVAHMWRGR